MTATATSSSVLEQLVKRAQRLYSLPGVAMQVLELTKHPRIDTQALKDCIENDPALTTKILRVVNSSLFGMGREITDLSQSLTLLGTKPLKLLVLGFSLPEELLSDVETEVLQQYWQHTVIKAVAAREISELLWDIPGDEPFIAGLLQDIGMLVLIQSLGESYVAFLDRVFSEGGDVLALETSTLGFDHAILSARLLGHWQLPRSIVQALGTPHDVARILELPPDERALPQILHLADLIARFLVHEDPHLLSRLLEIGRQYQELSDSLLETLIQSLEQKVPQLAEILALQLPGNPGYTAVLARAHQQLAEVAADAVMHSAVNDTSGLLKETQALGRVVERLVGEPMYSDEQPLRRPAAASAAAFSAAVGAASQVGGAGSHRDDPGLRGRVAAAVAASRQSRCALSLAFVELDDYESFLVFNGVDRFASMVDMLRQTICRALDDDARLFQVHDALFALILEGCDRQPAVETMRNVLAAVRQMSLEQSQRSRSAFSISAGVATLSMPPKNFPPQELIDAAQRCLDGVRLSGGDGFKSIEIY